MATHGVRYGASAALVAAQLHLGHELHHLEPSFLDTEWLKDQEDLIGDFADVDKGYRSDHPYTRCYKQCFLGP